jgi:hypothetical protein
MAGIEYEIGELLRRKGLTLGAVESATGGLISHLITNVPGSSDYYRGSVTSYSNEVKMAVVRAGRRRGKGWGFFTSGWRTGAGSTAAATSSTAPARRTSGPPPRRHWAG